MYATAVSPNMTGNDELGAGLLSISAFLVEVFFLGNARIGLQLNWPKKKKKEKQQPLTFQTLTLICLTKAAKISIQYPVLCKERIPVRLTIRS